MIMGHYKEMVDNLDLEKNAAEFISRNENHQKVLGNTMVNLGKICPKIPEVCFLHGFDIFTYQRP